MSVYAQFQQELLGTIKNAFEKPMPPDIEEAFLAMPRHLFVKKFYQSNGKEWELVTVDENNLELKLPLLYKNAPLPLIVDKEESFPSSISQPSFVLWMLDKLQLGKGHAVLEIGAASGWNAALMGSLVGGDGHVYSVEIVAELAASAGESIAAMGVTNVDIIEGDGGDGYAPGAPYDRIMFTVGSHDIPAAFYRQIKEDGLMLMVLKNKGYGDNLYLFRKVHDHFESIEGSACGFVSLTGKYQMNELDPRDIGTLPFWPDIKENIAAKQPFWCGSKSQSNQHFLWKVMGLVSFLSITEPAFEAFKFLDADGFRRRLFFGVVDIEARSLAVFRDDDLLTAFGNTKALNRLQERIRQWQDLGMPGASCFSVKAYPVDTELKTGDLQWITRRRDSSFLWTLEV